MLTHGLLDSYLNKNISEICFNGYTNNADNHCAHFVCHVLGLNFGMTCDQLVSKRQRQYSGANVRVHEVFAQCLDVMEIQSCPSSIEGLVFISAPRNFEKNGKLHPVLRNVSRKHIGLLLNDTVWHYSNIQDKVIKQAMSEFLFHYRGQLNALWYGSLPIGASPIPWGISIYRPLACLR